MDEADCSDVGADETNAMTGESDSKSSGGNVVPFPQARVKRSCAAVDRDNKPPTVDHGDFGDDDPSEFADVYDQDVRKALRAERYGSSDDAFRHWMPIVYLHEKKKTPEAIINAKKYSNWAAYAECRLRWETSCSELFAALTDIGESGIIEAEAYAMLLAATNQLEAPIDDETCHKILFRAFERNSIEAVYYVAGTYETGGDFAEKDIDRALALYVKAADLNHREAAEKAGIIFRHRKDCASAERLLRLAASLGMNHAKYQLALLFMNDCDPRRYDAAIPLVFDAAEAGDWEAMRHAAMFCEKGIGTEVDYQKARYYYARTAYTTWSSIRLAEMHRDGIGGPVNGKEAVRYFEYAIYNFNHVASYHLGMMFKEGKVVEKDTSRALLLLEQAANHDVPQASLEFAVMREEMKAERGAEFSSDLGFVVDGAGPDDVADQVNGGIPSGADDPFPTACAIVEAALRRNPRTAKVGAVVEDRTIMTRRMVLWFETAEQLANFVEDSFLFLFTNWEESETVEAVKEIAEQVREQGVNADVFADLDRFTLQWLSFVWWGTFSDLCAGTSGTSQLLISWFRHTNESGDVGLVVDAEKADFIEFLMELANE